jgi:hypothetical protein
MKQIVCRKGDGSIWTLKTARDVVAAYLNAACGSLSFPFSQSDIKNLWAAAVGNDTKLEALHNQLAPANELNCPLGGVNGSALVSNGGAQQLGSAGQPVPEVAQAPGADRDLSELYRPTPNPFANRTRFVYVVSAGPGDRVDVGVYDLAGRRMRTLVSGIEGPGRHEAVWDGRNDEGVVVRHGLYFIHTAVGSQRRTVSVVFMR